MIELKINNRVRTSAPNKTGDVDMIIIERKKKPDIFWLLVEALNLTYGERLNRIKTKQRNPRIVNIWRAVPSTGLSEVSKELAAFFVH
jgi:hypothetical protein